MTDIDFDFACRDDCLDRMVPSDLRTLVAERDRLREALIWYEDKVRKAHWGVLYRDYGRIARTALAKGTSPTGGGNPFDRIDYE
jgi:hypothetical protein